jgi:hypothetical protein
MQRRRFLAASGAASLISPMGLAWADNLPIPPGNALAFKVLQDGSPCGTHNLTFKQNGDDLQVDVDIELAGSAALIPYHYSLQATEHYTNGVFTSLDSHVLDRGKTLEVHARKTDAGYDIEGTNMPLYTGPSNTLPLTYWNKAMLNAIILNVETAHSYPVVANSPGWNNLPTANGGSILAQRYDLSGKLNLSVWYDQENNWAGLAFKFLFLHFAYQKIT